MRKKLIILMILILLASILYLAILKKEKVIESNFNAEDEIRLETEDFETENIEITQEEILTETIAKTENVEKNKIQVQRQEITTNDKQVVEVPKQKQNQEQLKTDNQTVIEKLKQEEQKQKEELIIEEIKKEKQEETKVEIPQEIPKEEQHEEIKEQEITEEYKTNDQMINQIKTIIENNETDDMKTYGYEIVVDSTIPELTNEFTFTQQRVINKITWKCGIIRIYARDYYFNGNHISTQCFII